MAPGVRPRGNRLLPRGWVHGGWVHGGHSSAPATPAGKGREAVEGRQARGRGKGSSCDGSTAGLWQDVRTGSCVLPRPCMSVTCHATIAPVFPQESWKFQACLRDAPLERGPGRWSCAEAPARPSGSPLGRRLCGSSLGQEESAEGGRPEDLKLQKRPSPPEARVFSQRSRAG